MLYCLSVDAGIQIYRRNNKNAELWALAEWWGLPLLSCMYYQNCSYTKLVENLQSPWLRQKRVLLSVLIFSGEKKEECGFSMTLPAFLSGQHSHEGAEHKTTGGVHVQCVEKAGLRRGLSLALPVHRLKLPSPNTDTTTIRRGALNPTTQDAHRCHQYHHTQPHVWLNKSASTFRETSTTWSQ